METNKINKLSNNLYSNLIKTGIQSIRDLFLKEETVSEKIKYDRDEEYLKQMLISQLNLGRMLLIHKYFSASFDLRSRFNREVDELRQRITSGTALLFNNDILDALFGNTLEISTPEEYEIWRVFVYQDSHNGKRFDEIYFEEETKWSYENETNPFKKFIQSFEYRKMQKWMFLEDYYVKKVREMIRTYIKNSPEDIFNAYRECHTMLEKGVVEYEELKTVEDIIKMVLTSLQCNQDGPINIEEVCYMVRKDTQIGIEFRQKQVTGINKAYTIDFEKIPESIRELQEKYEETYNKEQSREDYIRDVTKIYVDFIYMQPYEDGNKRTALCLFNSMLLSKGIIPPPISLINNEQMTEAFYKVQQNDYTMLQDIIINKYRKMQPNNLNNNKIEGNKQIDIQNEK